MSPSQALAAAGHSHVFLGEGHARNERAVSGVIALCLAMMAIEIGGGLAFGSIALVADGLHMSTHAGALLLAALAYAFARRHAHDARFSFGTGKLGDLAGFTSAVVLAMIALLIGYEAVTRWFSPTPIRFGEAVPIAALGLVVNVVSAWLLSRGPGHGHGHGHAHGHDHGHPDGHGRPQGHGDQGDHRPVAAGPARRVAADATRSTPDGDPAAHGRDNNMRAAAVHVLADAAVSVLVIAGLIMAKLFGWLWMDPAAGLIGAAVIASWSYGLVRDTGAILLDMTPDPKLAARLRGVVEAGGDTVADLHLWRLGPGHLGAIVAVATRSDRTADDYRARLGGLSSISHLTIEVRKAR